MQEIKIETTHETAILDDIALLYFYLVSKGKIYLTTHEVIVLSVLFINCSKICVQFIALVTV